MKGILDTERGPRWLIIQLARFGDLMQTAPVVAAAVEQDPAVEVHLLVDAPLGNVAKSIRGVAKVHTIDRGKLLKELAAGRIADAYSRIGELAADLQSRRIARVVNLTHTPDSAYLARLSGAPQASGLAAGRRKMISADPWSRLFRVTLPRRDWGALHLVDIHLRIAGLPSPKSVAWMNAIPSLGLPIRPGRPVVGMQLGASSPLRRWPVEAFARTAQIVAERTPVTIVLVGTPAEQPLADEFNRLSGIETIDLVGRTDISQLTAAVARCRLILSGDTGTIHMAAALGVPTVGVYLGMARPEDTAPYQCGAVVFEPRRDCHPCPEQHRCGHLACHADIPPEAVAAAVMAQLHGERIPPAATADYRQRVVDFDDRGCLILRDRAETELDRRRRELRKVWLREFEGMKECAPEFATDAIDAERRMSSLVPPASERDAKLVALARLTAEATLTAASVESDLLRGNSPHRGAALLRKQLALLDDYANGPDGVGLLTHIFQLELEQPPDDSLAAAALIRSCLGALARRALVLMVNVNDQHQHPNADADADERSAVAFAGAQGNPPLLPPCFVWREGFG